MLYLFDLDGTLISGYMDNADKDYNRWEVLPGRVEQIAALRAVGHRVGIVTNQAGVAFGHIAPPQFYRKWEAVCRAFGLPSEHTLIAVCFAHPQAKISYYAHPAECARRKPSGRMIRELMDERPDDAAQGVLFVGDRPEDEAAAADAGVPFAWAQEFFHE